MRELAAGDILAVSELAGRIWRAHYVPHIASHEQIEYMLPRVASPQAIEKKWREENQLFKLIYVDDKLAGYIALNPKIPGHWFIDKFYIDQKQQRLGLGQNLLSCIISELKPSHLSLRVNRKNFQAINFYFKNGFKIIAVDILDIGGGFVMDDFIMEWISHD